VINWSSDGDDVLSAGRRHAGTYFLPAVVHREWYLALEKAFVLKVKIN
jgi:hypothetical protein